MSPEQKPDNVWISREEYDRLRQAQPTTTRSPQPVVDGLTGVPALVDEPPKIKSIQVVVGTMLAIGLFLSLTNSFYRFISVPILVILLIFAAASLLDFLRAKQQTGNPASLGMAVSAAKQTGKGSGKYRVLLIILVCVLAAPVVAIGGMILLFILLAAGSGGQSS